MARPTLWNHRKFRDLEMALKSRALAIGTLECLWRGPYDSGDPLIGSSDAVEHACDWKGKRGSLTRLLKTIGFIDLTPRGYCIHDLMDHAPEYVKKRRKREENRRVTDRSLSGHCPSTDHHSHTRTEHCALSTEPLPAHGRSPTGQNDEQLEPITPERWSELVDSIRHPKPPAGNDEHRERVLAQAAALKAAK